MFDANKDVSTLNGLIATVLDSIDGYQSAAQDVENQQFRSMFEARARDRQAIVADLQAQVARCGGNPEDDGTLLAGAHRAFMGLRDAVSGRDDRAVIAEVERGEDHIKAKFEDALADTTLSEESRQIVMRAWDSVKAGHDEVRDLKHALDA
jgi:uncharacterized protein (TIGR02284 family)